MREKIKIVLLVLAVWSAGWIWTYCDQMSGTAPVKTAEERGERQEMAGVETEQTCPGVSGSIETEAAEAMKDIRKVAITFDDGPDPVWTKRLLDGLAKRHVHATFFVLGKKVAENEALVQRMQQEGHLIGNHSYHHVQLNQLRETTVMQELDETNDRIYEATGYRPEYVRPPYGAWDKKKDCPGNMMTVYWTIDTMDWQLLDADQVVKRVIGTVSDGDIILLHDIYESSVEAALRIVDYLLEEGYELVTVDQLILE